jgi:PAS domain S-box-containing protein
METRDDRPRDAAEMRRRAEEIAREKAAQSLENVEGPLPEEGRRMLHELRVHQIELEMQNEELRRAEAELDAARARYFELYDLAPVGYVTISEKGLILEANLTAATLLGVARGALVKHPITGFICEEDQDIYYLHRKQLFATAEPQACELRMLKKDGTPFWVNLAATAAPDTGGERVGRVMLSDITEQKRAEAALETRAHQQSVIAELGSLALSATDLQMLFDRTTLRVAETLRVEYCKVLELLPDGSALKLVAGVGWPPGLVGVATASAGRESQAGFTLLTNEPVIVEDLRTETRFNGLPLLLDHGVVSGISVSILGPERPFGALGAHTTQRRLFTADDVNFLHAVAHLLSVAIQRQSVKAALSAERSLLRTLVDYLPDAVYVKDVAGRMTLANPTDVRYARVVSEAEMLGKTDFDLFPPDLAAAFAADDQQVFQTGQPVLNREEQVTLPDGSLGWQLTSKVPLRDSAGHVIGLVGIGHDITERTQAEAALRESERDLLAAQKLAHIGSWTYDPVTQQPIWSEEVFRIWGLDPRLGAPHYSDHRKLVHPEDYQRFDDAVQEAVQHGTPYQLDLRICRPDGGIRTITTICEAQRDADGRVVRLKGTSQDITERKQAEAERERLLEQVQAQARQIARIMDTVPEGVLMLHPDGQVVQANAAGVRDLATLAGAAVGERLTHLGDLPLAELLAAAAHGGPWHEIRAGQRTFEAIARPVAAGGPVTGDPAVGYWVLVINDVTYAHGMRDQLQQQERLAAVGQLAAGIAHDFNNILAIIALHAAQVALAPGLAQRDRERLAVISEQTDHATRLVQQILDFSRRAVLERRPLDLGPLLQEQVKLLERTLPETIAVNLACEPGEHVVLADPTRLQQMLMNLAVNARDAMPAGGTLRLTLAGQDSAPRPGLPDGSWVRLEVADSGTGITPEAQAHLFEPFFTTKPPGQGTGLGLAQVHGIVKQHDGEIVVHSAVGEGTTFIIYLPAEPAPVPAVAAPKAATQEGGGETILVVEDNAALREAMCDLIEALGYEVVGASNGVEALAVLEARGDAIALVLSDLMMPVMGGEALLAAIQARRLNLPVMILSGYPLEGELAGLKARGLAGWLLKPVSRAQLAGLLAQVLASPRS